VLNTLLDKYADEGVQEIEDVQVLKLKPFDSMGVRWKSSKPALVINKLMRGSERTGKRNLPVTATLA
jgi:type I site-specific restriction endonuclease